MSIKEAGETARTALGIFRGQPLVLALIMMNLALMGLLYWNAVVAEKERERGLELLYDNRKFVGQLLANCYPTPPAK